MAIFTNGYLKKVAQQTLLLHRVVLPMRVFRHLMQTSFVAQRVVHDIGIRRTALQRILVLKNVVPVGRLVQPEILCTMRNFDMRGDAAAEDEQWRGENEENAAG